MKKGIWIAIALFTTLLLLCFVMMPGWYMKNSTYTLSTEMNTELQALGDSALRTLDVPVATIIIYKDEIIGRGFNTVSRNNNIGGHAEINAISDAIYNKGSFNQLHRDSLLLITTFEPCKMCEGAIVENRITHVVVVKKKTTGHWLRRFKDMAIYQWHKQVTETDSLQEYLFEKHPDYEHQKAKPAY